MSPSNIKPSDIIDLFQKDSRGKYGIISLNNLISRCSIAELESFQKNHKIEFNYDVYTKLGYLLNFGIYYYNEFRSNPNLKERFSNALNYLGSYLLEHDLFKSHLTDFDFISKQELIDAFSNLSADLGMSVYNTKDLEDFSLDLYLTTSKMKTEAVFIRTGFELNNKSYSETLNLVQNASSIALWTVFVTTPVGVYKIGLKKLIKDMEKLNAWFYVIDPSRMRIFGINKGKKTRDYDETKRDQFIHKLPHESIRSPSKVVKISNYSFNESEAYKPSLFTMFELIEGEQIDTSLFNSEQEPKYRKRFKNLIVIDSTTGTSILSFANEVQSVSEHLLSGFLTAMDNFVAEIGSGGTYLEDINYQGFYVQSAYAKSIKIALFLSEPSDQILKERLSFLIEYIEDRYSGQIKQFKKTCELSLFDDDDFIPIAQKILEI